MKTTADSIQVVEHLTYEPKVVGSNPAADIFCEIIPLGHMFLLLTFEIVLTWHLNHLWRCCKECCMYVLIEQVPLKTMVTTDFITV